MVVSMPSKTLLRPTLPLRDESAQDVTIKERPEGKEVLLAAYNTGDVLIWSTTALRSTDRYSGTKLTYIREHANATPV
jgi:hypothetical protein